MKVCVLVMMLENHVNYDYVFLSVVLGLMHGCSYLANESIIVILMMIC